MSSLTLEIEKALPSMEPVSARNFELAVRAMLSLARCNNTDSESEFYRLVKEEEALRIAMHQQGRQFAASDRLTRDELHSRHALH
jgi:hypothetical protein